MRCFISKVVGSVKSARNYNYSIFELLYNIICVIIGRVYIKKSRIIRFPITIRGKKYIDFGENLTTGKSVQIDMIGHFSKKALVIGNNVGIGKYGRISCSNQIIIGNNVLMGSRVLIIDNSHGKYYGSNQSLPNEKPNERIINSSPILIGDNVWIGEGVVIQQGVNIGSGSIIGANSVVTSNIPANCIAGGVPAKVLKLYDSEMKEWVKKT